MNAQARPAVGRGGDRERVTDAELIAASRGDPELFEAVFRRHYGRLHQYVSRRLGADAADDVVADTFLAAFRERDRYDVTQHSARPWLYGIATNLIGRHRRAEVRLYRALARTGFDPVTEPFTGGVEARVAAQAAQRRLAAAIGGLSAAHRDVLLLTAWGELGREETADALGITAAAVRVRLHRARKKVREALGGWDPSDDGLGTSDG